MAEILLKGEGMAERLPIWWRESLDVKVLSEFTEEYEKKYIIDILSRRVEQPIQVWKEAIIDEYNKFESITTNNINTSFKISVPIYKTQGKIGINISKGHKDNYVTDLKITNANQWIKIPGQIKAEEIMYDLSSGNLYLDDKYTKYEYETYPEPKISDNKGYWSFFLPELNDYKDSTLDIIYDEDGNPESKPESKKGYWYLDGERTEYRSDSKIRFFEDEYEDNDSIYKNKIQLTLEAEEYIISNFENLYIVATEIESPCFTVEQNIKLSSLTFLPIKEIKLYGLQNFTHNPTENGWKFLWSKKYPLETLTVYDHISKQFPVEKFYAEVYFYGLTNPISIGFPQEEQTDDHRFLINPYLDKWGKFYDLPRRKYKKQILAEEERKTYPVHYPYDIEQDYYYEQRLLNEYVWNDEAINSIYLKDKEDTSLIRLQCTNPFVENLGVLTESIEPNTAMYSDFTEELLIDRIEETGEKSQGTWNNIDNILKDDDTFATTSLKTKKGENVSNLSYQSTQLKCYFDLNNKIPENTVVTGIKIYVDQASNESYTNKRDDERTILTIPTGDEVINIPCSQDESWNKNRKKIIYGGEKNLFQQTSISKEQLSDNRFCFTLGITNDDINNAPVIGIYNISIQVFYRILQPKSSLRLYIQKATVNKDEEKELIIYIQNKGNIPILNEGLFIINSNEIEILNLYEVIEESDFEKTIIDNSSTIQELNIDEVKKFKLKFKGTEVGYYTLALLYNENIDYKNILVIE